LVAKIFFQNATHGAADFSADTKNKQKSCAALALSIQFKSREVSNMRMRKISRIF